MPKVNPNILRWARETAGLTLEEAATKLDLHQARGVSPVDRLAALESGADQPTRPLLTRMAKQYRRPLLTFYMTAPPRKGDRGQDFRTLPADHSDIDEALLDALIRDVKARQSMVRALLEDEEDTVLLPFVGSARMSQGVSVVLASVQKTIQLDMAAFRAEGSPSDAFNLLRDRVEAAGVFVLLIGNLGSYHTALDLETFRGFALADDIAPFVIINDQDADSARSFTLVHELVHIWLGQTGVSASRAEISIEKFCNDVASEFLLPSSELQQLAVNHRTDLESVQTRISDFARNRNLSASMVAYKLHRMGTIDFETWKSLSETFRRMWLDHRKQQRILAREEESHGPTYYPVRRHRIGKALLELVSSMMHAGAITTSKAATVLGVKAKNVQNLLDTSGLV
jgi:Zn-dependent peptidase ImmA (M78 family)/transcriptional regulator with XRE-family HTH domain